MPMKLSVGFYIPSNSKGHKPPICYDCSEVNNFKGDFPRSAKETVRFCLTVNKLSLFFYTISPNLVYNYVVIPYWCWHNARYMYYTCYGVMCLAPHVCCAVEHSVARCAMYCTAITTLILPRTRLGRAPVDITITKNTNLFPNP